jgi:transposase
VEVELRDQLTLEPLRARVERLRCFRGIDDLTALTIAAELGDARRFPSASRVMAFTGLVPRGTRNSGCTAAIGASPRAARPNNTSPPPSRVNSRASSGRR